MELNLELVNAICEKFKNKINELQVLTIVQEAKIEFYEKAIKEASGKIENLLVENEKLIRKNKND